MANITIENLQAQINNVSANVSKNSTEIIRHVNDVKEQMQQANARTVALQNEDVRLHRELNELSATQGNHTIEIGEIKHEQQNTNDNLGLLQSRFDEHVEETNAEHTQLHHEITHLAAGISENEDVIEQITHHIAAMPECIALNDAEWEALKEKDPTKFYFVWEAEENQ